MPGSKAFEAAPEQRFSWRMTSSSGRPPHITPRLLRIGRRPWVHRLERTEGFEAFPGDFVWNVTGQDLQVIRAEIAPGTDFGLHTHHQEQIICVLQGQLEFTVDGETRIVGPGQVIHAPPGVEHGGRAVSETR